MTDSETEATTSNETATAWHRVGSFDGDVTFSPFVAKAWRDAGHVVVALAPVAKPDDDLARRLEKVTRERDDLLTRLAITIDERLQERARLVGDVRVVPYDPTDEMMTAGGAPIFDGEIDLDDMGWDHARTIFRNMCDKSPNGGRP